LLLGQYSVVINSDLRALRGGEAWLSKRRAGAKQYRGGQERGKVTFQHWLSLDVVVPTSVEALISRQHIGHLNGPVAAGDAGDPLDAARWPDLPQ
jgi:hypothetical protein